MAGARSGVLWLRSRTTTSPDVRCLRTWSVRTQCVPPTPRSWAEVARGEGHRGAARDEGEGDECRGCQCGQPKPPAPGFGPRGRDVAPLPGASGPAAREHRFGKADRGPAPGALVEVDQARTR